MATPATGDAAVFEISTNAAGLFTTNDAPNIIARCGISARLLTSGAIPVVEKVLPCLYAVKSLERIYLHSLISGTTTVVARATIHFR